MLALDEIHNGDCLELLPRLPDACVDLIVNDPPHYGVLKDAWDRRWPSMDEYLAWCRAWLTECFRVLKPTGSLYLWGSIGERSDSILRLKLLMDDLGYHFKDWITWTKQRGLGNRRGWLYTREEVLWFVKDPKTFVWNADAQYAEEERKSQKFGFKTWKKGYRPKSTKYRLTNVWRDIPETTWDWTDIKTKHSTPKPIKALERILRAHTSPGEIVLDCFLGSGSTAVAAQELDRRFIGMEIDPEYCQIARKRLDDLNQARQSALFPPPKNP